MKRFGILLFFMGSLLAINAQIAKWLIPPSYDKIRQARGLEAISTDSAGVKTIWTMDGKRVLSTTDDLFPFREGMALAVKKGVAPVISKVYTEHGKEISLQGCKVAHKYPFFSNGKLLVLENKSFYRYADKEGKLQREKYVDAYPYFNGYASCDEFLDMKNFKDLCHFLIDENGEKVNFTYIGKTIDKEDVKFISSVNDENIGIVVVKSKVFFFNGENRELSPVYAKENPVPNKKEQVKLVSDIERSLVKTMDSEYQDSIYVLYAKYGKNDAVSICFDLLKRPLSIRRNGQEYVYEKNEEREIVCPSNLRIEREGDLVGLYWENMGEMLPAQFEEVVSCIEDKAMVKLNGGKYGLLQVFPNEIFKLTMNNGETIPFRHKKTQTSIRADFPTFLSAEKVNLEINPGSGCNIDKTSKTGRNTDFGNVVEYDCVLSFPSDLPADSVKTVEYPVTVYYDGLKSNEIQFDVKAWHCKYFVVDIDESQTMLENGTVSFVLNISVDRLQGEGEYPLNVEILTDSLQYSIFRRSESRRECKVYNLKEGVNNLVIQILEEGCPPAEFPFDVEYYKPVAKAQDKPEEKVTIKKKEKVVRPRKEEPVTLPRLKM